MTTCYSAWSPPDATVNHSAWLPPDATTCRSAWLPPDATACRSAWPPDAMACRSAWPPPDATASRSAWLTPYATARHSAWPPPYATACRASGRLRACCGAYYSGSKPAGRKSVGGVLAYSQLWPLDSMSSISARAAALNLSSGVPGTSAQLVRCGSIVMKPE